MNAASVDAAGDFDGDGKIDLLTARRASFSATVTATSPRRRARRSHSVRTEHARRGSERGRAPRRRLAVTNSGLARVDLNGGGLVLRRRRPAGASLTIPAVPPGSGALLLSLHDRRRRRRRRRRPRRADEGGDRHPSTPTPRADAPAHEQRNSRSSRSRPRAPFPATIRPDVAGGARRLRRGRRTSTCS